MHGKGKSNSNFFVKVKFSAAPAGGERKNGLRILCRAFCTTAHGNDAVCRAFFTTVHAKASKFQFFVFP
jgi:hypothetical protein